MLTLTILSRGERKTPAHSAAFSIHAYQLKLAWRRRSSHLSQPLTGFYFLYDCPHLFSATSICGEISVLMIWCLNRDIELPAFPASSLSDGHGGDAQVEPQFPHFSVCSFGKRAPAFLSCGLYRRSAPLRPQCSPSGFRGLSPLQSGSFRPGESFALDAIIFPTGEQAWLDAAVDVLKHQRASCSL